MSALSDLLNRHIADKFGDASNRRIAETAGVSRGTIDNYRNGTHPSAPSEEVLQAFHNLLGVSLVELREAAGVPRGEAEPYVPPPEFNRLSHSQRTALDEFVRSFIGPQGVEHAVSTNSSAAARASAQGRSPEEVKPPSGDKPKTWPPGTNWPTGDEPGVGSGEDAEDA